MTSKGCYDVKNSREVMRAIIWKLRTDAPWRDIPAEFCPWQAAFNPWAEKGLWAEGVLTKVQSLRSFPSDRKYNSGKEWFFVSDWVATAFGEG